MKIAVTRELFEEQIDRLRRRFDVKLWRDDLPPGADELDELLEGVTGALTLLTERIDGELLDRHPSLRVVSNYAVGFDNIDVEAATARGVAICTTPDVLTNTTAEFTIALAFAAARNVAQADRAARAGDWKTWYPMRYLGIDLTGSTLGIVGLGRIGRRVAEIASAIGMDVITSDPGQTDARWENVGLLDLMGRSDIVSIHTPLNASTSRLIDKACIEAMADHAILINTARGGVVDTDALVEALSAGHLGAVALDVTDPEPLPSDHPLYTFDNVTITPHIASATVTSRVEMARLAVDNLIAILDGGDPPNCLNPEVLSGI